MKFSQIQSTLLEIARQQAVNQVLENIVNGLAQQSEIALARIWLVNPGDICSTCVMSKECLSPIQCLHLAASQGKSIVNAKQKWDNISGEFRRIPIGIRKVGHIGETGKCILVKDTLSDQQWIAYPQWVKAEKICSFAGQPLIFRQKVLGVLAVFSRAPLGIADAKWLRVLADHAAVAIANAKAYEEIDCLRRQLQSENDYLREEIQAIHAFGEIVGEGVALQKVLQQVQLVAPTLANVLILGESGTGKELIARAIHKNSQRQDKPLVKVNCGAIPKELFESEFFGHVKGAFTGAFKDRIGRFQMADGGTLFLDEVGEIPLPLQSKLLRVLQEGQFERVGEGQTRNVDVRIIAATNRQLMGNDQQFRQDLYHRLCVFPIELPPLKERREDIPILAQHFLQQACHRMNCPCLKFTQQDIIKLQNYHWPGNIRELQNVIERAVISARHGRLFIDFLTIEDIKPEQEPISLESKDFITQEELKMLEYNNILKVLKITAGKVSGTKGAAELLGVRPTTLFSRMKKLGL